MASIGAADASDVATDASFAAPEDAQYSASRTAAYEYGMKVVTETDMTDVEPPNESKVNFDDDVTLAALYLANSLKKAKQALVGKSSTTLATNCARILLHEKKEEFLRVEERAEGEIPQNKLYFAAVVLYIYIRAQSLQLPVMKAREAEYEKNLANHQNFITKILQAEITRFDNTEATFLVSSAIREALQSYSVLGWRFVPIEFAAKVFATFVYRERFYLIGDAIRKANDFKPYLTYINIERELSKAQSARNAARVALYLEIQGSLPAEWTWGSCS